MEMHAQVLAVLTVLDCIIYVILSSYNWVAIICFVLMNSQRSQALLMPNLSQAGIESSWGESKQKPKTSYYGHSFNLKPPRIPSLTAFSSLSPFMSGVLNDSANFSTASCD
eukprot:1148468-Pelagomonas_calceolata.AAC.6